MTTAANVVPTVLQSATAEGETRLAPTVAEGAGAEPRGSAGTGAAPRLSGRADTSAQQAAPLHPPWRLPAQGLVVFHGGGETARLSHYFLPRLLLQGKQVLMLDGANCADPRLLERLARQRGVPFQQFSRQIEIARAFTCFQLTELIARLPRLLADFPAQVLIVTAFPELYFDEDVRDWNACVAFEQALGNVRRWGRRSDPLVIALFSSATTFIPSRARQRFFAQTCAVASEVWKFSLDEQQRLLLTCERAGVGEGFPTRPGEAALPREPKRLPHQNYRAAFR